MREVSGSQDGQLLNLTDGRLKIRHLRLVTAIAQEQTLAAAADELDVSQPVVSRGLQEVEAVLGVRLFERGRGGVRPTPAGERFLVHAKSILTQLGLASRDLLEVSRGQVGRVVIGTGVAGFDPVLPLAVESFHRERPGVVVAIHEAPPAELLGALINGVADFVIGRSVPTYLADQLAVRHLYRERLVPTVSTSHELATSDDLKPEQLSSYRWVVPDERTAARADLAQAFLDMGIPMPPMRVECSSILTATELVKRSGYIAPLPLTLAQRDSRLSVLNFPLGDIGITLSLISRKFSPPSSVAKSFEQHIDAARDRLSEPTA